MRLTRDQWGIQLAQAAKNRSTCVRRSVGCVLVNYHNDVIGTGYNGVPRNLTHCIDKPCPGANAPSGENLSECYAVHAEVNALLQCPNVYDVDTVYCTTAPCFECTKALLNSGAQRIVFVEDYPHSAKCKELWVQFGKEWIQFDG